MKTYLKFLLTMAAALLGTSAALADPPRASHDNWQNTNYASHYVRYDSQTRTYVETVDCRPLWRFTLVSNEMNTLTLYDASRGMTVRLDYSGMYLKPAGAANFTFYQNGTFGNRWQFKPDAAAITKLDGCKWIEWFSGQSAPTFSFQQRSFTSNAVELYDASRDMWVKLENTAMSLRTGNNPYAFFKNGKW
jgi:hypothetical protein